MGKLPSPSCCTVSFTDSELITHSIEVQASTLYEAAVLALRGFRDHEFEIPPAAQLKIEVRSASVAHILPAGKVERWLDSPKNPADVIERNRLKAILRR